MLTRTLSPLLAGGFLVCVSFFLSSCQPKVKPESPLITHENVTAEFIIERLTRRQAEVRDLKSFVRTTVKNPDQKQSFKQVLLISGENALRLDTYGMFGQALGVFIYKDHDTALYDPGADRMVYGPAVWEALEKMIGVSIDFTRYIGIFSGGIPQLENLEAIATPLSPNRRVYQFQARDKISGDRVDIEIDSSTLLPSKMVRRASDRPVFEVRWEDYRKVGDKDFPHSIALFLNGGRETVTVKFTEPPLLNVGLPANTFELVRPGGGVSN